MQICMRRMQASVSIVQHFARPNIAANDPTVRQAAPARKEAALRRARRRRARRGRASTGTSGLCLSPCQRCAASRYQVGSGRLVRVTVSPPD